MNDQELNRRELTGDDALRFARESGMERASETRGLFIVSVGDLTRFARLVREGWTPPRNNGVKTCRAIEDCPHPQECCKAGGCERNDTLRTCGVGVRRP